MDPSTARVAADRSTSGTRSCRDAFVANGTSVGPGLICMSPTKRCNRRFFASLERKNQRMDSSSTAPREACLVSPEGGTEKLLPWSSPPHRGSVGRFVPSSVVPLRRSVRSESLDLKFSNLLIHPHPKMVIVAVLFLSSPNFVLLWFLSCYYLI